LSGKWFQIQVTAVEGRVAFVKATGEVSWTLPKLLNASEDKLERIAHNYALFKRKWKEESGTWTCIRTGFKQTGCPFDCDDIFTACYSNNLAYLELYLFVGGDKHTTDGGKSLLHFAAAGDSLECARMLIDNGLDLNCLDESGNTPIAVAVQSNSLEVLRLLIFEGAKLDILTTEGGLLHTAAIYNTVQAAIVLVYAGVSTTTKNKNGQTPLDIASSLELLDFEISVQQALRSLFYSTSPARKPQFTLEYECSQAATGDTTRVRPSVMGWLKSLTKKSG